MARLQWNSVTERFFEVGLDQGVLYTPDGSIVPWNGLVSVDESIATEFGAPVYVDGQLMYQDQTIGDFEGTLNAFTFPDEFYEFAGFEEAHPGVFLGGQPIAKTFGLSWRTSVGNGNVSDAGYKIHILYNALAVPSSVTRDTMGEDADPVTFAWDLRAIPSEVEGYRPTAYVVIDSRKTDKYRLESIERYLYGGMGVDPKPLGTIADLMQHIADDVLIRITDNGDGTWTAEGPDDLVTLLFGGDQWFQINSPDVTYLDETTFTISTTEY